MTRICIIIIIIIIKQLNRFLYDFILTITFVSSLDLLDVIFGYVIESRDQNLAC